MAWQVEFTDEFEGWWETLDGEEQDAVDVVVGLLEEKGPQLSFPQTTKITSSRRGHLRELRIQYKGEPYRILYAFDPRRVALLLIGGSKTGDDRWYEKHVPVADSLYDEHLEALRREGLIDGTQVE
jgi:hypothetical protein